MRTKIFAEKEKFTADLSQLPDYKKMEWAIERIIDLENRLREAESHIYWLRIKNGDDPNKIHNAYDLSKSRRK